MARRRRPSTLDTIRRLATEGRVQFTTHADEEMAAPDCQYTRSDVANALQNATEWLSQDEARMHGKVYGPAFNGEVFATVVIVIADDESYVRVISVHPYP